MPQRGRPHPSLPVNPLLYDSPGNESGNRNVITQNQGYNVGAMAAQALTSSLANPYGQPFGHQSYTNPNYHSYFVQAQRPMTTSQGYTLSSTYVPNAGDPSSLQCHSWPQSSQRSHISRSYQTDRSSQPYSQSYVSSSGDIRCTYDGCSFTGSKKTVEIHRMDRHLIFPPGWKKEKNDWDADPSLKGKPVPVPGTGVTLDTPEAIDAWITERKKRWPSKQHVEDKKRKAQEAADRGQIDPSGLISKSRKWRKVDDNSRQLEGRGSERDRGRGRGRGKNDWNHGRTDSGWRGRGRGCPPATWSSAPSEVPRVCAQAQVSVDQEDSVSPSQEALASEESDSGSDMDHVKDAVSSKAYDPDCGPLISEGSPAQEHQQINENNDPAVDSAHDLSTLAAGRPFRRRKLAPQPRAPPQSLFPPRSSLLRSLLLPEIRRTVSNLSQAIHFLVENDFLEGVELNSGDAESQRIKVLDSIRFTDTSDETVANAVQA